MPTTWMGSPSPDWRQRPLNPEGTVGPVGWPGAQALPRIFHTTQGREVFWSGGCSVGL